LPNFGIITPGCNKLTQFLKAYILLKYSICYIFEANFFSKEGVAMQDMRKNRRIEYRDQVVVNNIVKTLCTSLSEGGVFLSTGYYFKPDSIIDLELPLNRNNLKLSAQVRRAQKDVGVGATFMDLNAVQREALRAYVNSRLSEISDSTKKRILHIDPDAMKRRLYKSKLVSDGYIVFEASNGKEALEILNQRDIDLALIELYFSPMEPEGLDIISIIRKSPKWEHIPIIVLSAKGILYDIKRAKENGANEYLQKMTTTPVALSGVIKKHMLKIEAR
jgi:CheY-like chemotaxis protein